MKREFLEGLGIQDKDVIQKIMDANGADVEAAKQGITAKDTEIEGLKNQLSQRDADMKKLKDDLTAAQADASKLQGVSQSLTDLQSKYETEKTAFEKRLSDQAYEFAVREKVGELQFSSKAAKEAFTGAAIAKQFKMDNGNLLGYADFLTQYKADDPGAFAAEKPADNGQDKPQPRIVAPTQPGAPGKKPSLSELMRQKNENPSMNIDF